MADYGFWQLAEKDPAHLAVIEPDGTALSAGELLSRVNQVTHALRAMGIGAGDVICVMMKNEAAFLEVYLAATQMGVYVTPANSHLAPPEVAYQVEDSGAKAVFCSEKTAETCKAALVATGFDLARCFVSKACKEGFRTVAELREGQPTTKPEGRLAGLPMTYTSGTTGKPKGVRRALPPVAPEDLASNLAMFLMLFGITPHDAGVHLVVSPLYHTAVLNFATNHLHFGHTLVLMDKWTPEATLENIAKYRVTTSHMVPTQFRRLLALPEDVKRAADVSSLRHMIHSAAPCPVDVKRQMLDWWGDTIYEYYAASEGGGTLATPSGWRKKPGTVGNAWPISQIKVMLEDGSPAGAGVVGTVYIAMGQHKFEYHKDKGKTDKSYTGDFFTVGDAGYLDEDGYLFLVDRKSDMIISGGVNIYPAEIEAVLSMHPKVADVAVFGIPHDDWGEEVKAVIEPAASVPPTPELAVELLAYARERLASFKLPKTVDFIVEMPRDPNGKLYKRRLRDPYWAGRSKAI